jgi:hypothetical protein
VACAALLHEIGKDPDASQALRHAAHATAESAAWLRQAGVREAEAGATPFLAMLGTTVAGWLCRRVTSRTDAPPAARMAAAVFVDQVLPRVHFLGHAVATPSAALVGVQPIA